MKFGFTFKHMDTSEALVEYATDRLHRIEKFELKPLHVHFSFEANKKDLRVDALIKSASGQTKATAVGDDMYAAVDEVVDKLSRQLAKHKSKVQHHKKWTMSDESRLERMNEQLEHDFRASRIQRARKNAA